MVNQYNKKQLITKELLEELYYHKKLTYKEIAKKTNLSIKIIFNRMKEYNLTPRKQSRRPKSKYYRNGYVYVLVPNHPRADDRGRVFEHIIVMEQHLGRLLRYTDVGNPNDEIVHHKNGDKMDNCIENLKLTTNGEHLKTYHGKFSK